jgi:hypothetical protein
MSDDTTPGILFEHGPDRCQCGLNLDDPAWLHDDDCELGFGGTADLDADRDITPANTAEPSAEVSDADMLLGLELAAHNWRADALLHRGKLEGAAASLAILVSELAVARRVIPILIGGTLVEIPPALVSVNPRQRSVMTIEALPIRVVCEYACETEPRALELGRHALKASTWSVGWAPHFIELLRPHCRVRAAG